MLSLMVYELSSSSRRKLTAKKLRGHQRTGAAAHKTHAAAISHLPPAEGPLELFSWEPSNKNEREVESSAPVTEVRV